MVRLVHHDLVPPNTCCRSGGGSSRRNPPPFRRTGTRTAAPLLPLPPYPRATAESCFAFTGEKESEQRRVRESDQGRCDVPGSKVQSLCCFSTKSCEGPRPRLQQRLRNGTPSIGLALWVVREREVPETTATASRGVAVAARYAYCMYVCVSVCVSVCVCERERGGRGGGEDASTPLCFWRFD